MVRVVEKRGKDCRLHYWFYPDSFDIWVSNLDAEESEKRDETFPRYLACCSQLDFRYSGISMNG